MAKPNSVFDLFRPDEVAECWDGVDDELYAALWDVVGDYEEMDRENGGPADFVGVNCVSKYWKKFPKDVQKKLNELAKKRDKEWSL